MENISAQHAQQLTVHAIAVAVLNEKIKSLEVDLSQTNAKLLALEKDRDSALRWGIMLLGTSLLSLIGWVVKHYEKVLA